MRKIVIVIIALMMISFISAFNVTITPDSGITCEPLRNYCDDSLQNVVKCNSDGTDKVLYTQCVEGCEYTADSAVCIEEKAKENKNIFPILILPILFILIIVIVLARKNIK